MHSTQFPEYLWGNSFAMTNLPPHPESYDIMLSISSKGIVVKPDPQISDLFDIKLRNTWQYDYHLLSHVIT